MPMARALARQRNAHRAAERVLLTCACRWSCIALTASDGNSGFAGAQMGEGCVDEACSDVEDGWITYAWRCETREARRKEKVDVFTAQSLSLSHHPADGEGMRALATGSASQRQAMRLRQGFEQGEQECCQPEIAQLLAHSILDSLDDHTTTCIQCCDDHTTAPESRRA